MTNWTEQAIAPAGIDDYGTATIPLDIELMESQPDVESQYNENECSDEYKIEPPDGPTYWPDNTVFHPGNVVLVKNTTGKGILRGTKIRFRANGSVRECSIDDAHGMILTTCGDGETAEALLLQHADFVDLWRLSGMLEDT